MYHNITRSKQLSGIELRIRSVYVKDNRTLRFWPFPGLANLYLLLFVVSDVPNQSIKPVQIITFPAVGDRENLPTEETIFYYLDESGKEMPGQLHLVASVIKSKKGMRNAGAILENLQQDEEYNGLLQQLSGITRNALTMSTVIEGIKSLGTIVGRYLGKVEDRPLATVMRSFTALSGDWDQAGSRIISIPTKNVDFHFDLTIRRKEDTAVA